MNRQPGSRIFSPVFALLLALGLSLRLVFTTPVLAHCPLCVAGAGVGLTLTRWVGVDDSITGIWLAAFLGAVSFWSEKPVFKFLRVDKPRVRNLLRPVLLFVIFAATLWSFYRFNLVVKHGDVFGLDKLTFGLLTGGIVFYLVDLVNDLVIKAHGRVYFAYQRIVVSLGSMVLLSLFDYILINYFI